MTMRTKSIQLLPRSAFRSPRSGERGGILVVTIIFCALVGLVLAAYLSMLRSQHKFTHRSQVWNDCMPLCEAGIEEAMAHLNYSGTLNNFAINGWALSGNCYRKEINVNGSIARIAISNDMPPSVFVSGLIRAPLASNYLTRTVRLKTRLNQRFPYSCLSKGTITMSGGNAYVDSYDSTDPLQSTLGRYDPLKRDDEAIVATISSVDGQINVGNASVFGSVATGPGGDVAISGGSVGSILFNANPVNDGKIESGAYRDDVNVYIPDAALPVGFSGTPPLMNQTINGTNYTYVLGSGDYYLPSLNLSGGGVLVQGRARLHVGGQTSLSSDAHILLGPNASIEYYAAGDINISGRGWVNASGLPKNFNVYGLAGCNSLNYSGDAQFIGTVYAPNSDIKMSGSSDGFGAMVGKSITFSGEMSFHYDESLKGDPRTARFIAASWQEL